MNHKQKQKLLKPKLDRRNAIKNIDYDASTSGESTPIRSRSLDLSPVSSRTSFRVLGSAAEFDQICRSLGLSGPEDFSIPAAAWEARKALSSTNFLPRFSSDPPRQPVAAELAREFGTRVRFSDEIEVENEKRRDIEDESNGVDLSSVRNGGGGIKGVRPPPVLAPPPAMRRPVVDNVSSTWDLLKSFAPQNDEPLDSLRGGSEVACSSEKEDVVIERNKVNGETAVTGKSRFFPRAAEHIDPPAHSGTVNSSDGEKDAEIEKNKVDVDDDKTEESWSSTSNDEDEDEDENENPTMILEPVYGISPNGQFKRTINSWQKGDLLGSGSFGTVYEGYTE